jgi:hypothetical protein
MNSARSVIGNERSRLQIQLQEALNTLDAIDRDVLSLRHLGGQEGD